MIVAALNRLHPCELVRCSDTAVEFLVLQQNGLHAECVLTFSPMRLIAHINKQCVSDCSFEVGSAGIINMAKILGVVYRRVMVKVPPMRINQEVYVDLSWNSLKITTFVIALALQTHGRDNQVATTTATSFLGSTWKLDPGALNIKFLYKRTCVHVNNQIIPYPRGVVVSELGFDTTNPKHLNRITTDLWRTMVEILSP